MKKIVIVNGVAKSGKDTFVKILKIFAETKNIKVKSITSIQEVKDAIDYDLLDVDWLEGDKEIVKDDKYRKFLSTVKDAWTEYNDGPFKTIVKFIDSELKEKDDIIMTVMVREPNEIQKIVDKYTNDCTTVLLERDVDIPDNHADMNVNEYDYDCKITNNKDIVELTKIVKIFFEGIIA